MYLHGITKVTQNKTGIYTKERSQQPLKKQTTIWKKDFKGLTKTTTMLQAMKKKPQFIMVKFQNNNFDAQDAFQPI